VLEGTSLKLGMHIVGRSRTSTFDILALGKHARVQSSPQRWSWASRTFTGLLPLTTGVSPIRFMYSYLHIFRFEGMLGV